MQAYNAQKWQLLGMATLLVGAACFYAAFLAFSPSNVLALLVQTIPAFTLAVSIVFPRIALLMVMIVAPLFGYLKKLLLIGGDFPYLTLYFLFGLPLLLVLGAAIGTALNIVLNKPTPPDSLRAMVVYAGLCVFAMVVLKVSKQGWPLVITGSAFLNLIWILYHSSSSLKFVNQIQKFALAGLLVSSFFGIYQYFFGLTYFDLAYVETGYLMTQDGAYNPYEVRPFATYGTPAQYGWAMVFGVTLCLFGFGQAHKDGRLDYFILRGLGVLYFCLMLLTSIKKGPMIGVMILPIMFLALGSVRIMLIVVLSATSVMASCVFYETEIIEWLRIMSEYTTKIDRYMTLNTFSVRVESFAQAFDPELVNIVGPTSSDGLADHNFISRIVYGVGIIPACILFAVAGVGWVYIQKFLRRYTHGLCGHKVRGFLSFVCSLILAGLVGTNTFVTFPVAFYLALASAFAVYYAVGKWRRVEVIQLIEDMSIASTIPAHVGESSFR